MVRSHVVPNAYLKYIGLATAGLVISAAYWAFLSEFSSFFLWNCANYLLEAYYSFGHEPVIF